MSATIHNVTEIKPESESTVNKTRRAMAARPTVFFFLRSASGPELLGADICVPFSLQPLRPFIEMVINFHLRLSAMAWELVFQWEPIADSLRSSIGF